MPLDLLDQLAYRLGGNVDMPQRPAAAVSTGAAWPAEARRHRHGSTRRGDFGLVARPRMGRQRVRLGLASAAGNIIGSRCGRRFGAMRGVLRIASFLGCVGLALLAVVPLTAPVWTVIIAMILAGSGIGMCLIGSITSAQNALSAQDTGAGTGALLVLRSVGGASGSTLAGAIIASSLIAIHHAAGASAS